MTRGVVASIGRAFSKVAFKPVNRLAKFVVRKGKYAAVLGGYALHRAYKLRRRIINEVGRRVYRTAKGEWRHARHTYLNPRKWWSAYKHSHRPNNRVDRRKVFAPSAVGHRRHRKWFIN